MAIEGVGRRAAFGCDNRHKRLCPLAWMDPRNRRNNLNHSTTQTPTASYKALLLNILQPPHKVSPAGEYMFKYISLWDYFTDYNTNYS